MAQPLKSPWFSANLACLLTACLLTACTQPSAPAQLTPAQPTPAQTTPAQTTPAQTTPAQPAQPMMERPMVTQTRLGLSTEHAERRPLLERIQAMDHGRVRATRTYSDGVQYMLYSDPMRPAAVSPLWQQSVQLTPQGVALLEQVIRQQLLTASPAPVNPLNPAGRILWIVVVDGVEQQVETASGDYASLPPFVRAVDEAVSQNTAPGE